MLRSSFIGFVFSFFGAFSQVDSSSTLIISDTASQVVESQPDLDAIIESERIKSVDHSYTYATFKGTKIINGHSIESPAAGVLQFIIYHRFSDATQGLYDIFGLDGARVRMGFDYGISRRLSVGYGRTSDQKTFDGYVKYKILMQTDDDAMPVSLVGVLGTAIRTDRALSAYNIDFAHRMSYLYQAMIARKFSSSFSVQLTPTVVYTNLVNTPDDKNLLPALGMGGRLKISKRTAINVEYFAKMPKSTHASVKNVVAVGVDIETGGHVFQLHLTNTQSMIEELFLPFNTNDFLKGQVNLGFNISRVFTVNKKAVNKYN